MTPPRSAAQSHSYWLPAARAAWLAFFALVTLTFLVAIPARWTELTHPTPSAQANLDALGWPLVPHAIFTLSTEVLFTGVFLLVSIIIFARRSDDRMALFTSLMLVAFGVGGGITHTVGALSNFPLGVSLSALFGFAAWASFTQFPYLFPSGRYEPAWARIPALIWVLLCIPWNFMPGSPLDPTTWPLGVFFPLIGLLWISFPVVQVYRFARLSNAVERQQTKWVLYALLMIVASEFTLALILAAYDSQIISYLVGSPVEPPTPRVFGALEVAQAIYLPIYFLLPAGMAVSILRYRLWDIDVVIRRTLIYSVLTGLLALTYFGSVLVLESVFRTLTGQGQNSLVVVFSTLAIAALFVPLRARVQRAIDRRLYRRKYDATRTLAGFAASVRNDTDLDRLSEQLVGVVEDSMQPEQVSLWLRSNPRDIAGRSAALGREQP